MYDLIPREMKTLAGDYQILYFRREKKSEYKIGSVQNRII